MSLTTSLPAIPSHRVPQEEPAIDSPMRAVLLSGPLGSGKTTILNNLLAHARQGEFGSYVVIENDVGTANVDAARVNAPAENVWALTSGCVCCQDLHALRPRCRGFSLRRRMAVRFSGDLRMCILYLIVLIPLVVLS